MSLGATDILYGAARSVAYVAYVGGVSVACGVVRTACSVGGLVANYLCAPPPQKDVIDKVIDFTEKHVLDKQDPKEFWQAQLARGLVELIPLFGGAYFTYVDNFSEAAKLHKYSIYQIGELADGINRELGD